MNIYVWENNNDKEILQRYRIYGTIMIIKKHLHF